jgi:hypothetical protein
MESEDETQSGLSKAPSFDVWSELPSLCVCDTLFKH